MPLWGANAAAANNKPKYQSNAQNAFTFGVDTTEAQVAPRKGIHAGWVKVVPGVAGIASANVNAAGSGYTNGTALVFSGNTVGAVAVGQIVTNNTGNIASIIVISPGAYQNNAPPTVTVANTGRVNNVTINNGGTGYNNTNLVVFTGDGDGARATITTNGSGGITAVTVVNGGLGYNAVPTVSVVGTQSGGPAGTGANLTAVILKGSGANLSINLATSGARINRVQYETLVAAASVAGSDSDDTFFPNS